MGAREASESMIVELGTNYVIGFSLGKTNGGACLEEKNDGRVW